MSEKLKAPFPWFGGKSAIAKLVWNRLGDVDNMIEPFAGSLAFLLARPHPPRIETVNDLDCYVSNFWRATQHAPEAVAEHADWPVNEADLHARHKWLVLSPDAAEFRQKMRSDPHFFDPKFAGWWCWGLCCWIGSGWCQTPESAEWQQKPRMGDAGLGVHRDVDDTHRPQLADAYSLGRGVNAGSPGDQCSQRRAWLVDWFSRLRDRLRVVRVCCGNWSRVCSSESVTTRLGITGVFLDPPYGAKANRDSKLYSTDSLTVADEVRAWCLEWGTNTKMRIALCGYAGEHEELESHGWQVLAWKAQGGYGNRSEQGKANAAKERIWFSPHCLQEATLFDALT